jgi:superfamily II DNA/RNA helicase
LDQIRACRSNPIIIIATPGRLFDLVGSGVIDLSSVSLLVVDEADRMLRERMDDTVRRIASLCHPRKQTLMWSATWPNEVQKFAEELLEDQIVMIVGANDITIDAKISQQFLFIRKSERLNSLIRVLNEIGSDSKILIFVELKNETEIVSSLEIRHEIDVLVIHEAQEQKCREEVIATFRALNKACLIATDLGIKGLDAEDVTHVINYRMTNTIQGYVHRIGRMARGERNGTAITLITSDDVEVAPKLVKIMKRVKQEVPGWLIDMAKGQEEMAISAAS